MVGCLVGRESRLCVRTAFAKPTDFIVFVLGVVVRVNGNLMFG